MRFALYVAGVTAALIAVPACAGGDGGSEFDDVDRLADAFCADLRDGLLVADLLPPIIELHGDDAVAGHVAVYVGRGCPGLAETHVGLRGYLEANGIDPDDLP